ALRAGATEGDWCPVNVHNFSSKKIANVYVLGDAAIANDMPKSAFSANSQAKVVAADLLAEFAHKERFPPRYRNTCWPVVAPDDDVKIGANYAPSEGRLAASGGFISERGEAADTRRQNFQDSIGWYAAITAEMFALSPPAVPAPSAVPAAEGEAKKP